MRKFEDCKRETRIFALLASVWFFVVFQVPAQTSNLMLALQYLEQADYLKAVEVLEQVVQVNPDNTKALYFLGVALIGTNELDRADRHFKQALGHGFYPGLRGLAINEMSRGNLDAAQVKFQEFLEKIPGDERSHFFLGRIALTRKEYAEAIEHFDRAMHFMEQQPLLKLSLAEAFAGQGDSEKALSVLASVPAEDPNVAFEAGVLLVELGEWKRSARRLEHALLKKPDFSAARYQLALCYARLDRTAEAKKLLFKIVADGQADRDVWLQLVDFQVDLEEFDQAAESLKQAIRIAPTCEECYVLLTDLYIRQSNYQNAQETIASGLRQVSASQTLVARRAQLASSSGRYVEAEKDYRQLLRSNPEDESLLSGLIFALVNNGRSRKASEELRRRIQLGSQNFFAYYLFGLTLTAEGKTSQSETLEVLDKAVDLSFQYTAELLQRARVSLETGTPKEALEYLIQAVDIDSKNGEAFVLLSKAFERLNDPDKAQMMIEKAERLFQQEGEQKTKASSIRLKYIRRAIQGLWKGARPL